MGTRDPRVDAYLEAAPEFARPLLERLREAVHAGCPDVVETMKWSRPAFEHHGPLCNLSAFKAHCAFGFWKHELVVGTGDARWKEAMGSFGRLTQLADLPSKAELKRMVKLAAKLNEEGVRAPRTKTGPRAPLETPPELARALAKDAKARKTYAAFPPSHRREYDEWIAEAKRDDTRAKRVAQTLEWLREGKSRHWKYR
ncbi:MAG: YdeI/OmpD-associated family protein [Planctomycetes bacterium]|nr:YdeI/OmpD-associated family protein [Planctomycetota bacterium]